MCTPINVLRLTAMHRRNLYESSSSSSDEEWETILKVREKRRLRPRIMNYEEVVDHYSNGEFKTHFR